MDNHRKKRNATGTAFQGAREIYEGKAVLEAVKRAGKNKNLHGHVHEILIKDGINLNPRNLVTGTRAALTKSPTAKTVDIVVSRGAKTVGRLQAKDTASSIAHTAKQISGGQYRSAALVGTKETKKAYDATKAAAGAAKTMKSSGISSNDTTRMASKVLGKAPTARSLAGVAKTSGAVGAVLSAGVEAVSSYKDYKNGSLTGGQYATRVAKEGVGGGLSAAGGAVAASAASAAVAGAIATAPAWVPLAVGTAVALGVGAAVKGVWNFITR